MRGKAKAKEEKEEDIQERGGGRKRGRYVAKDKATKNNHYKPLFKASSVFGQQFTPGFYDNISY